MTLLLAITLTDEQIKKIAWDLGQYPDDLPDAVESKDWLDEQLQTAFDNISLPLDI